MSSSAQGRDSYAQGQLQFGGSDSPYSNEDGSYMQEAESQHPFVYVPISAAGLAFAYNLTIDGQRWTGLNLTADEACQIFTGQLTSWSQLASTPGDAVLAGVDQPIRPVVRSDGAGESYALSQYCIAVDPDDWSAFESYVDGPGANLEFGRGWLGDTDLSIGQPIEYWPPALEGGDEAQTAYGAGEEVNALTNVAAGPYSIGYMASGYAVTSALPMASVQNAAGDFVQPNANSVQLGLSYASPNNLGTFNVNFSGSNPGAYFPATYSYVIAPVTTDFPTSVGADATLAQFLCYAVGAGQNRAAPLLFAPLSAQVTALAVQAIEKIPGAPPAADCGTGGPAPALPEFPQPALAVLAPVLVVTGSVLWRRRSRPLAT